MSKPYAVLVWTIFVVLIPIWIPCLILGAVARLCKGSFMAGWDVVDDVLDSLIASFRKEKS